MKSSNLFIVVACAGLIGGCATTVPKELVNARQTYLRVGSGVTAQVAPAELHVADQALAQVLAGHKNLPEAVRKVMARGRDEEWVVKDGISKTLNEFRPAMTDSRMEGVMSM